MPHADVPAASFRQLSIFGEPGSQLLNYSGTAHGGPEVNINADINGTGTLPVDQDTRGPGGQIRMQGIVGAGETLDVKRGAMVIDQADKFSGKIQWDAGDSYVDSPSSVTLGGLNADNYSFDGSKIHFWSGNTDVKDIAINKDPQHVTGGVNGVQITNARSSSDMPERVGAGPFHFLVDDTTTNHATLEAGQPYNGPVAGLQWQYINITPDNLNVVPLVDNTFIHTGSGTDAINLTGRSGVNVVDGGAGSNFITSSNGNDTIFDDARGATSDIWNTIQNFHPGDAATLWGVTQADFNFAWADGEGAQGHEGLTLHATPKAGAGPVVSVTFAGHSMADLGSLSISQNAQANYTCLSQS